MYSMTEQKIHFWNKCSHCGIRPIPGIRYYCTTCPAGPDNDFCETCYKAYLNGNIKHPSINTFVENKKSHIFVSSEGKSPEQYDQWIEVTQPNAVLPSVAHGFIVRPEFRCGYDSYFGSHGFVVESGKGKLLITALHVLDELIKKLSINATSTNEHYTGKELPKHINGINLYDVLEEKWMLYDLGTAGPMLVLPNARTEDEEPYSYRDIAAFFIKENNKIKPGRLASITPDVGEPIWLAAKNSGNGYTRQAVVVEKTERTFIFRYKDPSIEFRMTSGAPILNKKGEVVGINAGGGFYKGKHFGHANHVENIYRHLEEEINSEG